MNAQKPFADQRLPEPAVYSDIYKEGIPAFVLSIIEDEFGFTGSERPDLWDIPGEYQKDGGNFWVLAVEGAIVGTIGLKNYGQGRGYLKRMYVAKDLRRKGIAKQLFATLLSFAKTHGYKQLYLSTVREMDASVHFYTNHGFTKIDALPADMPDFDNDLFFRLDVKSAS